MKQENSDRLFEQDNAVYGRVIIDTLLDASLTPERLNALKGNLSKTAIDDCVILFAAGHGLIDESLDYYLATNLNSSGCSRTRARILSLGAADITQDMG